MHKVNMKKDLVQKTKTCSNGPNFLEIHDTSDVNYFIKLKSHNTNLDPPTLFRIEF